METVVELLDGSLLVVEEAGDRVTEELETWALVPEDPGDEQRRTGTVWQQALEAGPLVASVFGGLIANAAWAAFPAAARFLSSRRSRALDSEVVAAHVRTAAQSAFGLEPGRQASLREIRRDGDGTWRAVIELPDGGKASARTTADGVVTHLRRVTRPGE